MDYWMVTDCILKACIDAQRADVNWSGRWRTPPEYLFTTNIARTLYEQDNSLCVEIESDVQEAIDEGFKGKYSSETQSLKNKKHDIVLARFLANSTSKTETWAIVEVKDGWYGFNSAGFKEDTDRLIQLMEIKGTSVKYSFIAFYIFVLESATKIPARDSVERRSKQRIKSLGDYVREHGFRFGHDESGVHTDDEGNAWTFVVGRISRSTRRKVVK